MADKRQELGEVIADLKLIKEAVSKSDSFFRFIDTRGAMRSVMLAAGLLIGLISALFYYLTASFGSFDAIPLNTRIIIFVLMGLAWCSLGCLKLYNFLKSGRAVRGDMTLSRLFDEIYTSRLIALMVPFMLVIILVVVFLCTIGQAIYITPALAILFGLLFISMSPIVYLKELYLLSIWLIASGLLTLFTAGTFHPMAVLGFTFSTGFILSGLLLYLNLPGHER